MRSTRPLPGNPWPQDMVITVDDSPHALLELLWIREARELHPEGADLPPPLTDPPAVTGVAGPGWQEAWPDLWQACLSHAGTVRDPGVLARLHGGALDPEERARILRELVGPSWRDRFGSAGLTADFERWRRDTITGRFPRDQERRVLDALVPAWEAGLSVIVQLPCRGTFTRRIGPHALLVTAQTRADDDRYRQALGEF